MRLPVGFLLLTACAAKVVTLSNVQPRLDVLGEYVDCHDGMIVAHGSQYFLYGEYYNASSGNYPWPSAPFLSVYTSPDLVAWSFRGLAVVSPPDGGTQWIPNVVFDNRTQRFIMWYGTGDWTVATSNDGIAFNVVADHITSRLGGGTDGTGLLIDDDGMGYVIFAALVSGPVPMQTHLVSIEALAPDFLSSTKVNVTGFFPDGYVESPALFTRTSAQGKKLYYATYGSCCCACRGGTGVVVFTAESISGPWTRQSPWGDINCANTTAQICGGYAARTFDRSLLVYNAQWFAVSLIPTVGGGMAYLLMGRRWLSGPNNPPGCDDLCGNSGKPSACSSASAPGYLLRTDFDVWYPLQFNDDGSIVPIAPLPIFTLDLPG
jgi:hypothetical protein